MLAVISDPMVLIPEHWTTLGSKTVVTKTRSSHSELCVLCPWRGALYPAKPPTSPSVEPRSLICLSDASDLILCRPLPPLSDFLPCKEGSCCQPFCSTTQRGPGSSRNSPKGWFHTLGLVPNISYFMENIFKELLLRARSIEIDHIVVWVVCTICFSLLNWIVGVFSVIMHLIFLKLKLRSQIRFTH